MFKLLRISSLAVLTLVSSVAFGQGSVNIAGFKALGDKATGTLSLNKDTVLYADGANEKVYVRDASGAICFYKAGLGFNTGDVIDGSVSASVKVYYGLTELVAPITSQNITKVGAVTPRAKEVTVAQAGNGSYESDYVQLTNVKFDGTYAIQGDAKIKVFNGLKLNLDMRAGESLTIKGIVNVYNSVYEIYPIEITGVRTPTETPISIADFKNLPDSTYATLNLNGTTVLATDNYGTTIYIRDDAHNALQLYKVSGLNVKAGDTLSGTIYGMRKLFYGVHELVKASNANVTVTSGSVAPTAMNITTYAELSNANNLNDLVQLAGVKISGGYAFVSATDSVQLYDGLHLGVAIPNGTSMTVTGILTLYKGKPEIFVTSIDGTVATNTVTIAQFKALPAGTKATLNLSGVQVTAMNDYKDKIYVRDANGDAILIYKATGLNVKVGDILDDNSSITGILTIYKGLPELTNGTNVQTFLLGNETVITDTMAINDLLNATHLNDIVTISGVTISNGYAKDSTTGASIKLYNGYLGVSTFPNGTNKTITGILSIYYNTYELLPVSITDGAAAAKQINDNVIYNLNKQIVDENYKGIVIKNGKKYLLK